MAACRDETCALSLPLSHSRSPLVFSQTHGRWRRGRRTRSPARTASRAHQACSSPEHRRAPRVPSPSAPLSLRAPLARRSAGCTSGCSSRCPILPTPVNHSGKGFLGLLTTHWLLPLFFPCPKKGLLWGRTLSAPLSLLSRRLCLSTALGRKLARGPGLQPGSGARGVRASQAPGPLLHSRRLAGRTGCLPPLQPSPVSQPRPLLPLGCARGTQVRAAADFSSANSPRIWRAGEPETGTDEVNGIRKGEEEKRRQKAARAGLRVWYPGGKNWRR